MALQPPPPTDPRSRGSRDRRGGGIQDRPDTHASVQFGLYDNDDEMRDDELGSKCGEFDR